MEFLVPFMKNRSTRSNLPGTSENILPSAEADEEEETQGLPGEEGTLSSPKEDIEIPTKRSKNRNDHLLQQFIQSSEKRMKQREEIRENLLKKGTENQNDGLYNFFISMYATTKSLSPRLQRQVRKKVFEAVMEAEEQNEFESSQASCSTPSTVSSKSVIQEDLSHEFPEFFQPSHTPFTTDNSQAEETILTSL